MKKSLFVAVLLFSFITRILSQDSFTQRSPEERAKIQTEWMKENLNLDEGQLSQVEPLNLEYALKMEKVKTINGKLSKMKKAKSISDEKDQKLKEILTEEQFDKYLEKKKELREKVKDYKKSKG